MADVAEEPAQVLQVDFFRVLFKAQGLGVRALLTESFYG